MYNFKPLFLLLTMFCLLTPSLQSQTYNPSLFITTSTTDIATFGKVDYYTTAPATDGKFTLLGDGFFSILDPFSHQFKSDPNGFTTSTYFSKRYKKHIPVLKTKQTNATGNGNSTNNRINMAGGVQSRVATSWTPTPGIENFFLLIFENTSPTTQAGCIEFYYHDTQLALNNPQNILQYNNWVHTRAVSPVSNSPMYNRVISWKFDGLGQGEQRVVYIPMTAAASVGSLINVGSKYDPGCVNPGTSTVSNQLFNTGGSPHDPNQKYASTECVFPELELPQSIQYTITFQNEGSVPAEDVYIVDFLEEEFFDLNSVTYVDSEYPCSFNLNDNMLEIFFEKIKLPGLKQKTPNTYSYDETESFVTFSICTKTNLEPDTIFNKASIYFDSQPPIQTNTSEVLIDGECTGESYCGEMKLTNLAFNEDTELTFFPNPVDDLLTVKGLNDDNFVLLIFNLQGELIKEIPGLNRKNNVIDLSRLPRGIYLLTAKNERVCHTQKIIKN